MTPDISRLLHGDCPPRTRSAIASALAATRPHRNAGRRGSIGQISRLAAALPGVRDQLADPDLLADLLSQTAVSDPSLFMSALLHYCLAGGTLANLGTEDQVKSHLDTLDAGKAKGLYLITEMGTSGSLTRARARAVYQPGGREFLLTTPDPHGLKFSSVSPDGGPCLAIVFAQLVHETERGVYPFVVPLTDSSGPLPGVAVSSPVTVSSLPLRYGIVRLTGVRVPYRDWLSGPASIDGTGVFYDPAPPEARLTRSLAAGGASLYGTLPSVMAAISRTTAARAVAYARRRTTQARLAPGVPLITYRTQQLSLFGAFAEAVALTAVAQQARLVLARQLTGDRAMQFGPWSSIHPSLPVYKAIATEGAVRVVRESRERCGLHGILDINQFAAYQGLAEAFVTAGGDNRLILMDTGMALAEGVEPVTPAPAHASAVTSPNWWPAVCRAHRGFLTAALRDALCTARGDGLDRWNPLLEDARALGQAHAQHLTAQATAAMLDGVADPRLRELLTRLTVLYGIVQARRTAGPLIASGALSPAAARALMPAAHALCEEIVPHLPVLHDLGELTDHPGVPLESDDYATALTRSFRTWHQGGPA